jgi:hypothetical protein
MVTRLLVAAFASKCTRRKVSKITSRHNELFHGLLWRHKQTERQSLPPLLIRLGLKNLKALFTSLLLELAEMDFLPAFV